MTFWIFKVLRIFYLVCLGVLTWWWNMNFRIDRIIDSIRFVRFWAGHSTYIPSLIFRHEPRSLTWLYSTVSLWLIFCALAHSTFNHFLTFLNFIFFIRISMFDMISMCVVYLFFFSVLIEIFIWKCSFAQSKIIKNLFLMARLTQMVFLIFLCFSDREEFSF